MIGVGGIFSARSRVPTSVTELTIYTTSWCPFSLRLLSDLNRAGIEFTDVDVDEDAEAAELVKKINHGNRTVPTVVFADGTSMTNPPVSKVAAKLGR